MIYLFLPNINPFLLNDIVYEIKIRNLVFEWNSGKITIYNAVTPNRDLTIVSSYKIGFRYIVSETTAHIAALFILFCVSTEYL